MKIIVIINFILVFSMVLFFRNVFCDEGKVNYSKVISDTIKVVADSWFLTVFLCVALQNNWISPSISIPKEDITYDVFANTYAVMIWIVFILYILFKFFTTNSYSYIKENDSLKALRNREDKYIKEKFSEIELQQLEIRAVHEAGHIVMADALGVKVVEATILPCENNGGHVKYVMGPILTSEDLKKKVLIIYGGLFAEKLLLESISNGCMGTRDADLEQANYYLKEYVILTDEEISLAGFEYEEEKIKKKVIQLSKEWAWITKCTLKKYIQELYEKKEELLNDYYKKKRD